MAWFMTGIMMASTAMSISETNKAATREAEAANTRAQMMYNQQEQEQQEIQAEAGLELTNRNREALREQASMRAGAAESGVVGISPLRELANVYMQESIDAGSIISKEEAQIRSSGMQSQQTYLEGVSAVNVANSKMSTGLNAALQIGMSGAQGYGMMGGFSATAATPSFAGEGLLTSPGSITAKGAQGAVGYSGTAVAPAYTQTKYLDYLK